LHRIFAFFPSWVDVRSQDSRPVYFHDWEWFRRSTNLLGNNWKQQLRLAVNMVVPSRYVTFLHWSALGLSGNGKTSKERVNGSSRRSATVTCFAIWTGYCNHSNSRCIVF
jgi:hypothetical protein